MFAKVLQWAECPSSLELATEQLASRAAAWDRAASTAGLLGPFIHLSPDANITVCNLSHPIARINANLISPKILVILSLDVPVWEQSRQQTTLKPKRTGSSKSEGEKICTEAKSIGHALNEL